MIKTLLRSYEGIFDHPIAISEKVIAGILKVDAEEYKTRLDTTYINLGSLNIHRKKTFRNYFLRDRSKQKNLILIFLPMQKRKALFQQRVEKMISFIKEEKECRSRFIGAYFGDAAVPACGICDNCLREKATRFTKEDFDNVHHQIIALVKNQPLQAKDLLSRLSIKKEKAWKVIEFLQAENKIEMDVDGWVRLK